MGYKRGQYQAYIGEKLSSRVAPLELLCVRWSESLEQVGPLHLLRYHRTSILIAIIKNDSKVLIFGDF